jgi:hypothetical protein
MTIDKFDPNPVLVNINKLKPYKFVEDDTLQLVLVKPNDFLLEEPIGIIYSSNIFIEELVETDHYGNLFTKNLVKFYTKGLIADNLNEIEPIVVCPTKN